MYARLFESETTVLAFNNYLGAAPKITVFGPGDGVARSFIEVSMFGPSDGAAFSVIDVTMFGSGDFAA